MSNTIITKIRPAARIISTIGEDLVGDAYSAIVELVKNAYDADAEWVEIVFEYTKIGLDDVLKIVISDNGHGMSKDTVLKKWLVPATVDKIDRINSPKGRNFQGRKGIGRYAAAILGQELFMETIDQDGECTSVIINWDLFNEREFLEEVEIVVDSSYETSLNCGTTLSILAKKAKKDQWGRNELNNLTKELRKLKSPFKDFTPDNFDIRLYFYNCPFPEYNENAFEIEAFPISNFFDYRIFGEISIKGEVSATYENLSEPNLQTEAFTFFIKLDQGKEHCGPINFDIRVFDRDPEAIEHLINKGLIDPISKLYVGKRDAKKLLDEAYGVNLYREGFRIRPYGNGGIDWLGLDEKRIQDPSKRISNNQVIGFINIKPENISNLVEKSARDGLKENQAYFGLVYMLNFIVKELEIRRYNFRLKTGKGRKAKSVSKDLNELFDFTSLTSEIKEKLKNLNLENETINEVINIITKESEKKSRLLENIQNTIAIYQGQATLGKIITVLLHEGRKPVGFFKQQSPNLIRWLRHYKAQRIWDDDLFLDITDRLNQFHSQSEFLANLFSRLDPLAKQNKGDRIDFGLKKAIDKSIAIFQGSMQKDNIKLDFVCDEHIIVNGWEEDVIITFTNLLENSIYWFEIENKNNKAININVIVGNELIIHYRDNGPGIDKDSIESGAIFEPGFSKKINGTGLGLTIAGEAIERIGGSIISRYVNDGAYFQIELKQFRYV